MKKILKWIVVMVFGLCLMACGEIEETQTLAVSLVSGYHDNSYVPNFYSETVQNALMAACKTYGHVTVVVNDGSPYVALDAPIAPPAKEGLSENKKATIAATQVQEINGIISQAKAKTEEVDTMEAIHLAARGLRITEGERKVLILLDNGLSTKGVLNFVTGNLLQQDAEKCAEEIVTQLLTENEINDKELTGMDVIWIGLGDVLGAQSALSNAETETLKTVWKSVLEHMGAESVTLSEELPSSVYESGLPEVSEVVTDELQPVFLEKDDFLKGEGIFVLDEQTLPFQPDSTELLDMNEAKEVLTPLAELLNVNSDIKILLAGTTAAVGTQEDCKLFSEKRAYTIANLLSEMGVSKEQIRVAGLGYEHEYHVEDLDEKGKIVEQWAQKNRSVIILNADSAMAEKISNTFEIIDLY